MVTRGDGEEKTVPAAQDQEQTRIAAQLRQVCLLRESITYLLKVLFSIFAFSWCVFVEILWVCWLRGLFVLWGVVPRCSLRCGSKWFWGERVLQRSCRFESLNILLRKLWLKAFEEENLWVCGVRLWLVDGRGCGWLYQKQWGGFISS